MDTLPEKNSEVEISFAYGNKMITATGLVREVNNDEIVLDIDTGDNTVTLSPGTDIYLMKGGGLHNVIDTSDYPRIRIERVHERLHTRVDDILKVDYQKVVLDDYADCHSSTDVILERVFGETHTVPEVENISMELLYKLIYQLNLKVDRLMDAVNHGKEEHIRTSHLEQVNISAAGIRLNLPDRLDPGDVVALRITLPLETATRLQILGKVVFSLYDEERKEYRVAFKFLDLPEDMQETITRYVFKRQRELLRK